MSARLLLVRHGESVVNIAILASNNWEDNPLTPAGVQQARELGRLLADGGPRGVRPGEVAHLYTSGMQRARETATLLAAELGIPGWTVEPGLHEIEVGLREGERGQVALERSVQDFDTWFRRGDLSHGFEQGETGFDTAARVSAALRRIAARHDGQTVLVVSHGCALAMAAATLCGNLPLTALAGRLLGNCGLAEVVVDLPAAVGPSGSAGDGSRWTCVHWQGAHPASFATDPSVR